MERCCIGSPPAIDRVRQFAELPKDILERFMEQLIREQCEWPPIEDGDSLCLPPDLQALAH